MGLAFTEIRGVYINILKSNKFEKERKNEREREGEASEERRERERGTYFQSHPSTTNTHIRQSKM